MEDIDIYYRYDQGGMMGYARLRAAPITVAAQHLAAAAGRLAVSIVRSFSMLDDAGLAHLTSLFTLSTLWSLCIVIGAWVLATSIGGPIALAINGLLILWGLKELWGQLGDILKDAGAWWSGAYKATNDKELEVASAHFASAVSAGILTGLELVITHRAFRFAEGKIKKQFKPPDWLGREYEAALKKAEKRKGSKPERAIETAKAVASSARGRGANEAAKNFPTGAAIIGGVVAVLGVSAVGLYALSDGDKK